MCCTSPLLKAPVHHVLHSWRQGVGVIAWLVSSHIPAEAMQQDQGWRQVPEAGGTNQGRVFSEEQCPEGTQTPATAETTTRSPIMNRPNKLHTDCPPPAPQPWNTTCPVRQLKIEKKYTVFQQPKHWTTRPPACHQSTAGPRLPLPPPPGGLVVPQHAHPASANSTAQVAPR
jgi:hypothetical protein